VNTKGCFTLGLLATALFQAFPVLAADLSALPPAQTQGNITYITGGVGQPESTAMKAAAGRYDLALMFANRSREFLADVKVDITDSRGTRVLDITSGPILLVDLPDGRYTVHADVAGSPIVKHINVRGRHHQQVAYVWPNGIDERAEFAAFETRPMEPSMRVMLPAMPYDNSQYGGGLDHVSDGIWAERFRSN
jgi:hypothetical protein